MDLKDPSSHRGKRRDRTTARPLALRDNAILPVFLAVIATNRREIFSRQEVSNYFFPSASRSAACRSSRSSQVSLTNLANRPHFFIRNSAFSGV